MNILLLSQFFTPTKGGGEVLFCNLAKAIANDNNFVWVISNRIKDENYLKHKNIKIIFVPPLLEHTGGNYNKFMDNLIYSFWAVRKGYSIIKKEQIKIIHSNNFAPAFAGSLLSFLTSIPHITVIHDICSLYKDFWKIEKRQKNASNLNILIGPFFEKLIIKLKCSAIHTVSNATKNDLIEFGAKKPIYVIPNAMYFEKIKTTKVNPLQFIFLGRLLHYKNIEVVIKAINVLKKSYPNVILIIVGSGPYKENLENLVENLNLNDNVIFKGQLSEEEKNNLISTSVSVVFPSLLEGFGLVILEAFAFKKPILVSDVPPLSEIVQNGNTGYVIPPHNENAWSDAMKKIIEEPEKTVTMGETGRKVLDEKYDPQIMGMKIGKMYGDFTKDV